MSEGHSEHAPSGADSWMVCAGYINATRGLPDKATVFAAEGTCAHTIHESCLLLGVDPDIFVGRKMSADGFDFEVTQEWVRFLQPGIDRVREFAGKMFVEYRVDTTKWVGLDRRGQRQGGTLDTGVVGKKLIVIKDLKFGAGVPVSPIRNRQMMIYALGFWDNVARHLTDATDFLLIVDQPRCAGGGGEWPCTLDELLEFGEEVKKAADATRDPNAPRTASEKGCKFCPAARLGCDEYDRWELDIVSQKFEDLDADIDEPPTLPRQLTPERRAFVVKHRSVFTKWLEQLHADTLRDALAGDPTPFQKAVLGRKGDRQWDDEAVAEAFLAKRLKREQIITEKLISPAKAENLLSTKDWAAAKKLYSQAPGKPILVDEDDERPAITPTAEVFDDLDEVGEASDLLG